MADTQMNISKVEQQIDTVIVTQGQQMPFEIVAVKLNDVTLSIEIRQRIG